MDKCTIIILGATGDLTRRKLLPALYRLIKKNRLNDPLIIGAARDTVTAHELLEKSKPFMSSIDDQVWQKLTNSFHYTPLDFMSLSDYKMLETFVSEKEKERGGPRNRLIYLATAARFFASITQYLAESGVAKRVENDVHPWYRIAYEKPFGHDLKSAHTINETIQSCFNESQLYRVDHFLTKEVVGNIALIRFTNAMFEPLWNNKYIDNVQIIVSESIGLEGRAGYYDSYGALADIIQNHALELLALVAMEKPKELRGDYVRDERARVLKEISFDDGVLGQYAGYTQEPGVAQDSKTETFAAVRLFVNNERWKGVPFYIKTGKNLDKKETTIHVTFKSVPCLLTEGCPVQENRLTIQIAPEAFFSLQLNAKEPGKPYAVTPIQMEFCHSCLYSEMTPHAYETLFEEIIRGEQATSVRFDEIEYAWKVIDTIHSKNLPLHVYAPGSDGPQEALEKFSTRYKVTW